MPLSSLLIAVNNIRLMLRFLLARLYQLPLLSRNLKGAKGVQILRLINETLFRPINNLIAITFEWLTKA
jgi:hypothetical protein